MPTTTLTSKHHVVEGSLDDAIEFCFQQGWTDGLPVVPPTPPKVARMLEAARLDPKQQIAFVEHRAVSSTAGKVGVNAVMAGCRPEYMPVVVAAVEAIAEPSWSYHGPGTSTGGAGVLMIINGPIATTLDVNSGDNLFGPGWRSNLTIGRALRLVMRNVCGSRPGTLDRGTLGHPGKLSYVIAENETESPWPPLHVERGFRREQSTVTVMAAEAPDQFYNPHSKQPHSRSRMPRARRAWKASASRSSRTPSSTRTSSSRRSATSSSRSTGPPRPGCSGSTTPASRRTPRSSRRCGRPATSLSPASETEGPARRAVCSTESCWRRTRCRRPRSSRTSSRRPLARWLSNGAYRPTSS